MCAYATQANLSKLGFLLTSREVELIVLKFPKYQRQNLATILYILHTFITYIMLAYQVSILCALARNLKVYVVFSMHNNSELHAYYLHLNIDTAKV